MKLNDPFIIRTKNRKYRNKSNKDVRNLHEENSQTQKDTKENWISKEIDNTPD